MGGFTVNEYASHVFSRPLSNALSPARISLAENLDHLACLLARCNQSDCSSHSEQRNVVTISLCLPVITRLLDGSEAEVTSDVRRKVLAAFNRVIKHHGSECDPDGLERAVQIAFGGITDKERSVRLGAG